jgi:DNA-binding MarR family transcriptional regulator
MYLHKFAATKMGIDQDIKQTKFKSIYQKCFINIVYTASYLNAMQTKELKRFGISPQQFNLLRILRGQHPSLVNLNDIACRMIDKSSNTSRLVEKLRVKELVVRNICKTDRRAVDIGITEQGLELLRKLDRVESNFFKCIHSLNQTEAEHLSELLDKIRT